MNWTKLFTLLGRILLAAAVFRTAVLATGERRPVLKPEEALSLWEDCTARERAGEIRKALGSMLKLLRSYPDNPTYLSFEAGLYNKLPDYRKEAAAWELYTDVAPFPNEACPQLGRAYARAGLADEELDACKRCLAFLPGDDDLKLYYALALEKRGEAAEAERFYAEILEGHPGYHDAALGLARIRMRAGRLDGVEKLIKNVLEKSPKNTDALFSWAMLASEKNDNALAERTLEAAIAVNPDYTDIHRFLGRLYSKDGNREGAIKAFENILRLEPGDAAAAKKLRELREENRK